MQSIDTVLNDFEVAKKINKQPVGSCRGKPCAANAIEQRRIEKCDYWILYLDLRPPSPKTPALEVNK
jgi:hypothetical protein